ncbi:MAG: hypothetical protein P1U47_14170 [Zhongshania sp.]|uniref:hypothetical protein n=1 Tax=Zhongshania sp. TaxID=1971902 RepID=UPI0026314E31|nr:hypothetical protein [Zhongshania sp.]MDF1693522.1 hypothetical protein [Zhongshania sp.]
MKITTSINTSKSKRITVQASLLIVMGILAVSSAFAQKFPNTTLQTSKQSVQPKVNEMVFPSLQSIYGSDLYGNCGTFNPALYGPVFEKGVSPMPSGTNRPYAHIFAGPTGLQLAGFRIDRIEKAQLAMPTGSSPTVTLSNVVASNPSSCSHLGTGKGSIELSMNIPEVTTVTNAKLYLYGRKESANNIIMNADGSKLRSDCPKTGCTESPAVSFQEIDVIIHPRPSFNTPSTTTLRGTTQMVGGSVQFPGSNLSETKIASPNNGTTTVSRPITTSSKITADVFSLMRTTPLTITQQIAPSVQLVRGSSSKPVSQWDTMRTRGVSGSSASLAANRIILPAFNFTFIRVATPAPAVRAMLKGFDPGNILYVVIGGIDSDDNGNNYAMLNSPAHCEGITPPLSSGNSKTASRADITLKDINWGVENRGNGTATGNFVAELHTGSTNGPVVATFSFTNLGAGTKVNAPAYRRPQSKTTVAILSSGPACFHAGLENEGFNDNAGYFVTVRGVANSFIRLANQ